MATRAPRASTASPQFATRRGNRRVLVTIAAILLVVLLGVVYLVAVSNRGGGGVAGAAGATGDLRFVELADGANRVETVSLGVPGGERRPTGQACLRTYSAAGVTVCLKVTGIGPTYSADVTRADGSLIRSVPLPGIPSRARVSASGAIVSWTAFVSGDSYTIPGGFSTRTGFLDLRDGTLAESIEHFTAQIDGKPMTAIDANYWGITVGQDDRTFYATLGSGDRTWLVEGDLKDKTVHSVRHDAECPSLSPDGTRVAYKKRVSRFGPWELAVLDLSTQVERRLPGTAGIDDQAEWLDDGSLAYAAVPVGGRTPAVFRVLADGSAPGQLLIADAASPSVVR